MWYLFAAWLALSNTTGSLVTVTFLSSSHNFYRPYSLSLDYGGETLFLVSYLCLHKRSLAWAEFLWCMGQNGHGQNSGVSYGCVHHPSPWGVRKSLYFSSNAWALLICVQCIFFPVAFVLVFTGGDFLRIGLIYLEFPCTFCFAVSSPRLLFSG